MARVQVGFVADRTPDGNFLPPRPIYREIPDEIVEKDEYLPLDDLAKVFADKFMAYKRAELAAKRKAQREKK